MRSLMRKHAWFALLLVCFNAWALDDLSVNQGRLTDAAINQSGAHEAAFKVNNACVNESFNGKTSGTCEGIDPNSALGVERRCSGYNRCITNSAKRECIKKFLFFCIKRGYRTSSTAEWASCAGDSLKQVSDCTHNMDTSVDSGSKMTGINYDGQKTTGASIATNSTEAFGLAQLRDPNGHPYFDADGHFIGDDKATDFGLNNGEIFNRVHGGESLKDVLLSSPKAKAMSADDLKSFQAELDGKELRIPLANMKGGAAGASTADAMAGIEDAEGDAANAAPKMIALGGSGVSSASSSSAQARAAADAAARKALEEAKRRSLAGLYGEKSIFQQVSARYLSRSTAMRSAEYYFQKKAKEAPKDIQTLLK